MNKIALVAFTFAAVIPPHSARAVTDSPAPLHVVSCVVDYLPQVPVTEGGAGGFSWTNGVTVSVRNISDKTITAFTGGGVYNKTTTTDTVSHAIPSGGMYSFNKRYATFVYSDSMASCFVSKVTFADGSSWAAPPM